ncbi:MAG TPA: ATP-binding protein [Pseudolabrys sp.]|nr:ATP-binding protein [Pseudolabrys sp.]
MLRNASLGRRLVLGAAVFITLALIVAAMVIGFILHRFVQGQIDQRLDSQIVFLASQLRVEDGRLSLLGGADGPPFDRPGRGWYWQITGPSNTLRSQALSGNDLVLPDVPARPPRRPPPPRDDFRAGPPAENAPRPADGPGPDRKPVHFRIAHFTVSGLPVTIAASAPRAAVAAPLRGAMLTLGVSLAVLGVALVLAMLLQVRLGLRPLERLRQTIADVRAGRIERLPENQPREIQPLVSELNALLAQNAANLERARAHVANLAHGLKTPLATLAIAVSDRKRDLTNEARLAELQALVALMERRIRHHLGRARSAALSGPVRAQTMVGVRLADLGEALGKIHAGKAIALTIDVAPALAVACEQQDFDEMAGNLMENAFKWACGTVRVSAAADGNKKLILTIEDDGAGLRPDQIAQALRAGARLDESEPGFGFGLPIARELAELYGGELTLKPSSIGGLCAALHLPLAVG